MIARQGDQAVNLTQVFVMFKKVEENQFFVYFQHGAGNFVRFLYEDKESMDSDFDFYYNKWVDISNG